MSRFYNHLRPELSQHSPTATNYSLDDQYELKEIKGYNEKEINGIEIT